jgi:type I restriction enzyme S subunit
MDGRKLPVGWAPYCLAEIGGTKGGKTPSKSRPDFWESGTINWTSPKDMKAFVLNVSEDKISDLATTEGGMEVLPAGSVLMVTRSGILAHTFPVAISSSETAINQDIKAVRPLDGLNERFLAYSLKSLEKIILQNCSKEGTTVASVETKLLERLPLPLAPLNEQRRIAAKLDTTLAAVDACRQRLDGVAAILKRFRQAVLAAATSGELTQEWREENSLDDDAANNEIASIIEARLSRGLKARTPSEPDLSYWTCQPPASWMIGSVSMLAECLDSQRIPVKKEKRKSAKGLYPYYGANGMVDMVDDYIFDGEIVLVTEDETFYGREKPIAYRSSGKCWVNNHAHVLKPQDGDAADYLCYCLMYYPVLPWLTGTTGRAKLTQAVLNSLPIAIPPAAEMREIVIRVTSLFSLADQLEARLTAARKFIERLTPALLAKAFRGELVPQDPNDEPASVLLERIRAARQAEAGAGKPSRRGRPKAAANPDQLPFDAAPVPPDFLAGLLRECGPLSERALWAVSELEPERFQQQLFRELESGTAREVQANGQVLLEAVG